MSLSNLFVSFSVFLIAAAAHADPASHAKAAELSLHRIERLVILKKIDGGFENQARSLTLQPVAHQTPDQPSFEATIAQVAGADGSAKSVTIPEDEQGKALSFVVNPGGTDSVNAPKWPDQDAVTLLENSLHFIEENFTLKPELAPYNVGLTKLSLSQALDASGAVLAIVQVEITKNEPVLKIVLKSDGTVASSEIVAQNEE